MAERWSPTTLDEALGLKAEHRDALTVLAGGTDLMVYLNSRSFAVSRVLDIWRVDALRGIEDDGDGVVIGALETFTDIIASPLAQSASPALIAASKTVGAIQIQNRGTLGGNLANASPAADTPPALLAADATIRLVSARGSRDVPATGFFHGYKQLELADDELIQSIRIPKLAEGERDWSVKVGTRRAQAISKVVMAGRARLEGGQITRVGLSVGSVAPTTIRLPTVEAAMTGRAPDATLEAEVRAEAGRSVVPIDDVRSTADYRRAVTGNVAARFVRFLRG